jgi:hypothetical protein
MITFAITLRALKHPFTLVAVGLLLLNDHVLKAAVPSWFTGKLSDFAGLFFFPFILTAFLALPLDRWQIRPRQLMRLASVITLVWFTLVKTVPIVNTQMAAALGLVLGGVVHIALDSTDLVALPMIGLAWQLWVHLEHRPIPQPPSKPDYMILGLAALATIATSPCAPIPKVSHVVVANQSFYVGLSYEAGVIQGTPWVAQSLDDGITWNILQNPPEAIVQQLQQAVNLPIVNCGSGDPRHCYRITGEETVEESYDGGQSWQVAWRTPWGRRKFMDRSLYAGPMASCKSFPGIDLGPYDLALSEREGRQTLIVAMGNEGVLVRTPGGEWQRDGVLGAVPTPYIENYLPGVVFDILPELGISAVVGLLTLLTLSICVWWRVLVDAKASLSAKRSVAWVIRPSIGILLFIVLVGVIGYRSATTLLRSGVPSWMQGDHHFYALASSALFSVVLFNGWLALAAIGALVVGLVLTWRRVEQVVPQPHLIRKAFLNALLTATGVCLAPGLSFALWTLGVIPLYEIALAMSVILALLILWRGVRRVGHHSRMAGSLSEQFQ